MGEFDNLRGRRKGGVREARRAGVRQQDAREAVLGEVRQLQRFGDHQGTLLKGPGGGDHRAARIGEPRPVFFGTRAAIG